MPLSRIMLRTDRSAWENTTRRAAQAVAGGLHPIMMIVHISAKRVVLPLLVQVDDACAVRGGNVQEMSK